MKTIRKKVRGFLHIASRNISVCTLSVLMLLVAVVLAGFSVHEGKKVEQGKLLQTDILLRQRECTERIQSFLDTSIFLAEQAHAFIAVRDPETLSRYFSEAWQARREETALIDVVRLELSEDEAVQFAWKVKDVSERIFEKEAWAMRLTADSLGMKKMEMPNEVAAVTYENGEEALTAEEQWDMAFAFLHSAEYQEERQALRDEILQMQQTLFDQNKSEIAFATKDTQLAQKRMSLFNSGLLTILICFILIFYFLVLRPFQQYADGIERLGQAKWSGLKPLGCKEAKLFADTFNRIYSEFLENEKALKNERFRFRMALENTTVVIFEYDFLSDTYFGYGNLIRSDGEMVLPTERVIPQFLKKHLADVVEAEFVELAQAFFHSKVFLSAEMRVKSYPETTNYLWASITATPILDSTGELVRMIGKITNIESEKGKELALEDLKKRDSLTGLYTREAGIRLARDFMKRKTPETICGIFLLDMDDFEQINREEGSAFADAVLQEAASILLEMTGPDDYQIRLGGDEFMIFIKNCPKSRATVLGPQIVQEIQNLSIGGGLRRHISGSMGMCVTEVVDEYDGLYRCAESTLKYVKENRRGTAACYLDTCNELGERLIDLYPDKHEINLIDRNAEKQEALTFYALELLEKSKNLEDAVYLLLSRAGRSCGLERVSIAEINQEYMTCRYLYQWAAEPAARQGTKVYYITQEQLQALMHSYENGLSEQYAAQSPHNMGSILHAAIWEHGNYEGFMSFEVKQEEYQWTEAQRRLLKELTNVISSFVLKAKADSISRAKTEFLSRMSHEIRTPMNAISGMTEIALQMLEDRGKVENCLHKIKSANTYLLSLINDILDMSRIESGKVELCPEAGFLYKKLCELLEMLEPQFAQKGLSFTARFLFDKSQAVRFDFLRLNQVLINLLGNALKFTPPGGEVSLAAEQIEDAGQGVKLRFCVSDTGIGIAEEALGRIFHAFEQENKQTARTFGGTGLGLSISSRLIQMMGGRLEVDSTIGKGSRFFFTLVFPAASPEESEAMALAPSVSWKNSPGKSMKGMRLLLVEDNDLNREIAETLLTMQGFLVEHAENGRVGVERVAMHPAYYYDAILMDIRMPVMDGLEATRKIRLLEKEDSRSIPIIAMTANAFDEDMRQSMESGMNGHLSKPIQLDELLHMLQSVLEK